MGEGGGGVKTKYCDLSLIYVLSDKGSNDVMLWIVVQCLLGHVYTYCDISNIIPVFSYSLC